MNILFLVPLIGLSLSVKAEIISLQADYHNTSRIHHQVTDTIDGVSHEIVFDLKKVDAQSIPGKSELLMLSEKNIPFTKTIGAPRLPFKSVVVVGQPEDVQITVEEGESVVISKLSSPGQAEDCRCEDNEKKWVPLKTSQEVTYQIEYLGKYRDQDLSRVTITAAVTNLQRGETIIYPHLKAQIFAPGSIQEIFKKETTSGYDYLVVTPRSLLDGMKEFVQYKSEKGLKVKTALLEDIGKDINSLTQFFKSEYQSHRYKYALLVGTDDLLPNHKVRTSGSTQTPSDYPYFLMDSNDMIPDVQYGRVVASNVSEVTRQVSKWINYQERRSEVGQFLHMIGIASNEGSSPSDDEYVKGMERDLAAAYGTNASHFYQNDPLSRPEHINKAFNKGSGFLVYLGHGSGTSWASTGTYYTTASITQMNNPNVVQPVIIDVACQNGILKKGYFGETFMNATNAQGKSIGASMYYGGSVNISWHPPAIMARGIVKRTIANQLEKIGDALLAGHLYLLENHSDLEEVRDNFEWYHLFGEPSAQMYFK